MRYEVSGMRYEQESLSIHAIKFAFNSSSLSLQTFLWYYITLMESAAGSFTQLKAVFIPDT